MITLASPAKVNLFLRILRRRSDGYHELASLFQTIALSDTLNVGFSNVDRLFCNHPKIPLGPSNLIWKAVDLFRRKTGRQFYLKIFLDKRIPIQAGLGGGSSNAATVLWAVNTLLDSPVSCLELLEWASEIGSDVPFFFSHGTAYCTGRGEKVRSLPALNPQSVTIFKASAGLSTPTVYKKLQVESLVERCPEASLEAFLNQTPIYFNDLEVPAFELMPHLAECKEKLLATGFDNVLLAGSGASLIGFGKGAEAYKTFTAEDVPFQCHSHFINRIEGQWY
ncbi:MAG: 4-(cytidine 5'-diphospho)-2-C-methyl-D-erythritol kinase [Parachlamydiaceae bacterium]